ncbi:Universal stress protein family protein [compost metagenome]
MVEEFGWDNVRAEQKILSPDDRATAALLAAAARDLDADLMVMGGFGHSHLREKIFGGCTQALLEAGETPLLLMH